MNIDTLHNPVVQVLTTLGDDNVTGVAWYVTIWSTLVSYTLRYECCSHLEAEYLRDRIIARGVIDARRWTKSEHTVGDSDNEWHGDEECERCAGTGRYIVGTNNGKLVERGACYRCAGKGHHTQSDRGRNASYDNNYMRVI
jgi:hypothetical protein